MGGTSQLTYRCHHPFVGRSAYKRRTLTGVIFVRGQQYIPCLFDVADSLYEFREGGATLVRIGTVLMYTFTHSIRKELVWPILYSTR